LNLVSELILKILLFYSAFIGIFKRQASVSECQLVEKTKSSRAKPAISKEKYIFDKKTCKKVLSVSRY